MNLPTPILCSHKKQEPIQEGQVIYGKAHAFVPVFACNDCGVFLYERFIEMQVVSETPVES